MLMYMLIYVEKKRLMLIFDTFRKGWKDRKILYEKRIRGKNTAS